MNRILPGISQYVARSGENTSFPIIDPPPNFCRNCTAEGRFPLRRFNSQRDVAVLSIRPQFLFVAQSFQNLDKPHPRFARRITASM